jgi:hypothetical protein
MNAIKKRLPEIIAYADVLYYFEIMYLMVGMLFLYGKLVALAAGATLAVLLSVMIMMVYFRTGPGRLVQLILMEVHCAYALSLAAGAAVYGLYGSPLENAFLALRTCMAIMECAGIFLLTDWQVRGLFART